MLEGGWGHTTKLPKCKQKGADGTKCKARPRQAWDGETTQARQRLQSPASQGQSTEKTGRNL